jgi:predicted  nucleic acid-binding Zn-ribbon protein
MSAHNQGDEVASAGAAAAPAPAAGEGLKSKQHALEEKMLKLEADIKELKTKIAMDEADVKSMKNEAERVELRGTIKANTMRLHGLEARRDRLEAQIEKLSAPAEQPTSAGGCSPTSCLPLCSLIGLPRRGIARAPLATRI